MSTYTTFNAAKVKKGMLITVKFDNGKKRSGIITGATDTELTYLYFDESVDLMQTIVLRYEEVIEGTASIVVSEHLSKDAKSKEKEKTKPSVPFFEQLQAMEQVEELIRAFKHEDPQTLAVIASHLQPKVRVRFLYFLPEDVFEQVETLLDNVAQIQPSMLARLEQQLGEKFAAEKTKQPEEKKRIHTQSKRDPQLDPFGGLLGGLLGGGLGDVLKQFNANDIKSIFEEGMNQTDKSAPLPNPEQMREMLEQMPKMLEEMFGGLLNPNDQDDNEDDDFRGRRGK